MSPCRNGSFPKPFSSPAPPRAARRCQHSFSALRRLFAPYGQFVAGRVGEMKTAAAGEGEGRLHHGSARRRHGGKRLFEVMRVEHRQRLRRDRGHAVETAVQPLRKGGVGGPVIGEAPAEGSRVEGFHRAKRPVAGLHFQIVELAVGFHLYILQCSCFVHSMIVLGFKPDFAALLIDSVLRLGSWLLAFAARGFYRSGRGRMCGLSFPIEAATFAGASGDREAVMAKWVYSFGGGSAEGNAG